MPAASCRPPPGSAPATAAGRGRAAGALLCLAWGARRRLAAGAALLLPFALLVPPWQAAARLHAALPVLGNLAVCGRFGASLLPGREPLITRYTRFDMGEGMPPLCRPYTRALTWIWAVFLGLFAAAHALAALSGLWPAWAVLGAEAGLGGALFLGEHALRNLLFPQQGPATVRRTLRAVRQAHHEARRRHAAPG